MAEMFADDQGENATDALEALVGEGKKFRDVAALAKGKMESDTFIEQLKDEKRQLLEEMEKLQKESENSHSIADLMEAVRKSSQNTSEEIADPSESDEDFQEKVRSIMQGEEAKRTRNANLEQGRSLVLEQVNGDVEAAKTYLAEKAKSLGLTTQQLTDLSASSPKAFAELIGTKQSGAQANATSLPNFNSEALGHGQGRMEINGHHTKAWFDQQRKTMGNAKFLSNNKLQNDMMKARLALGERFNNN